jgi:diaminopimelate epimerase
MKFHKYHGLGNDYLVIEPAKGDPELTPERIRLICHRHYGVGGDGVLLGSATGNAGAFSVRIFNPDGSEAEKSGNGLRIFARYLYDARQVGDKPFDVLTKGGMVCCQVADGGGNVTVQMGKVSFRSEDVPVAGPRRDVLNEKITVLDKTFRYCAATIGNPHCVILNAPVTKEAACTYGPAIEIDARFPNRTNVQFMEVLDRANIKIEIWERGAGYTLASGSSSSAAAAVAHRLGLCDQEITVHMPGGQLQITVADNYAITMAGPVAKICEGVMAEEMA